VHEVNSVELMLAFLPILGTRSDAQLGPPRPLSTQSHRSPLVSRSTLAASNEFSRVLPLIDTSRSPSCSPAWLAAPLGCSAAMRASPLTSCTSGAKDTPTRSSALCFVRWTTSKLLVSHSGGEEESERHIFFGGRPSRPEEFALAYLEILCPPVSKTKNWVFRVARVIIFVVSCRDVPIVQLDGAGYCQQDDGCARAQA
jgi:hypothetical protein